MILTAKRKAILARLAASPASICELCEVTGKDYKQTHRIVDRMRNIGIIAKGLRYQWSLTESGLRLNRMWLPKTNNGEQAS